MLRQGWVVLYTVYTVYTDIGTHITRTVLIEAGMEPGGNQHTEK